MTTRSKGLLKVNEQNSSAVSPTKKKVVTSSNSNNSNNSNNNNSINIVQEESNNNNPIAPQCESPTAMSNIDQSTTTNQSQLDLCHPANIIVNRDTIMGPPTSSGTDLIANHNYSSSATTTTTNKTTSANNITSPNEHNRIINNNSAPQSNNVSFNQDIHSQLAHTSNETLPSTTTESPTHEHSTDKNSVDYPDQLITDHQLNNIVVQQRRLSLQEFNSYNTMANNNHMNINRRNDNTTTALVGGAPTSNFNNAVNNEPISQAVTMANMTRQFNEATSISVLKKRPGRPKGSKNKPKEYRYSVANQHPYMNNSQQHSHQHPNHQHQHSNHLPHNYPHHGHSHQHPYPHAHHDNHPNAHGPNYPLGNGMGFNHPPQFERSSPRLKKKRQRLSLASHPAVPPQYMTDNAAAGGSYSSRYVMDNSAIGAGGTPHPSRYVMENSAAGGAPHPTAAAHQYILDNSAVVNQDNSAAGTELDLQHDHEHSQKTTDEPEVFHRHYQSQTPEGQQNAVIRRELPRMSPPNNNTSPNNSNDSHIQNTNMIVMNQECSPSAQHYRYRRQQQLQQNPYQQQQHYHQTNGMDDNRNFQQQQQQQQQNSHGEFTTEAIVQTHHPQEHDNEYRSVRVLSTLPASDLFKEEIIDKINSIADEIGMANGSGTSDSNASCFLYCNSIDSCIERETLLAKNIVFITNHGFLSIVHQQIYVVQNNDCTKSICTYVIHEHSLPIAVACISMDNFTELL